MQLSFAGFFVRKFQVVNRNDFFKKVSNSFHVLCLNIRILRACALPKPFNIIYFLPPGFLSRFITPGRDDWHGFRLAIPLQATLRTDIRIRIRGRVIRIRIHEPRIRTIIRITAEQNTTTSDNRVDLFFYLPAPIIRVVEAGDLGRLRRFDLRVKAKPRTEIRSRIRGRAMRTRKHEPRKRTSSRITAEQNTTFGFAA